MIITNGAFELTKQIVSINFYGKVLFFYLQFCFATFEYRPRRMSRLDDLQLSNVTNLENIQTILEISGPNINANPFINSTLSHMRYRQFPNEYKKIHHLSARNSKFGGSFFFFQPNQRKLCCKCVEFVVNACLKKCPLISKRSPIERE